MKKAFASALIGMACLILIGVVARSVRGHQADSDDKPVTSEASGAKRSGKDGLKLDRETQERIGLELQPLKAATAHAEVTIYGTLEADPSEAFVLRAPVAGVLASERPWPAIGAELPSGTPVGTIRPRLLPLDRLTLAERLASTRADLTAARASAAAASAEANRLRQLNSEQKNASDKAREAAESDAAAAEARVRSSEASERIIAAALQPESNAGATPLEMRKGGQVLEVGAQPGESVEAGQMLLRVARFDRLLARLYVPPGQEVDLTVTHAAVAPAGHEEAAIPAQRVALAASVDPNFQGQMLLFRLSAGKMAFRPGQAITARLAAPGRSETGVLIPAAAVLRFQGQAWVYVQSAPDVFARRMVTLDHPGRGGWLTSGFTAGQQVVISGAQMLLSEEMKSQLESDEQ